ncbi:hypothetical protein AAMO2058_001519100, partial [Amorphochlora amoebiformis]
MSVRNMWARLRGHVLSSSERKMEPESPTANRNPIAVERKNSGARSPISRAYTKDGQLRSLTPGHRYLTRHKENMKNMATDLEVVMSAIRMRRARSRSRSRSPRPQFEFPHRLPKRQRTSGPDSNPPSAAGTPLTGPIPAENPDPKNNPPSMQSTPLNDGGLMVEESFELADGEEPENPTAASAAELISTPNLRPRSTRSSSSRAVLLENTGTPRTGVSARTRSSRALLSTRTGSPTGVSARTRSSRALLSTGNGSRGVGVSARTRSSRALLSTRTGSARGLSSTRRGSSRGLLSTRPGSSRAPSSTRTRSSRAPSSTRTGSSRVLSSTRPGSSRVLSSTRPGSSRALSSTRAGSSRALSSTRAGSSRALLSTRAGSSRALPSTRAGSSRALSSTRTGSSRALSSAQTGSSRALSSTRAGSSRALSSTRAGTSRAVLSGRTGSSRAVASSERTRISKSLARGSGKSEGGIALLEVPEAENWSQSPVIDSDSQHHNVSVDGDKDANNFNTVDDDVDDDVDYNVDDDNDGVEDDLDNDVDNDVDVDDDVGNDVDVDDDVGNDVDVDVHADYDASGQLENAGDDDDGGDAVDVGDNAVDVDDVDDSANAGVVNNAANFDDVADDVSDNVFDNISDVMFGDVSGDVVDVDVNIAAEAASDADGVVRSTGWVLPPAKSFAISSEGKKKLAFVAKRIEKWVWLLLWALLAVCMIALLAGWTQRMTFESEMRARVEGMLADRFETERTSMKNLVPEVDVDIVSQTIADSWLEDERNSDQIKSLELQKLYIEHSQALEELENRLDYEIDAYKQVHQSSQSEMERIREKLNSEKREISRRIEEFQTDQVREIVQTAAKQPLVTIESKLNSMGEKLADFAVRMAEMQKGLNIEKRIGEKLERILNDFNKAVKQNDEEKATSVEKITPSELEGLIDSSWKKYWDLVMGTDDLAFLGTARITSLPSPLPTPGFFGMLRRIILLIPRSGLSLRLRLRLRLRLPAEFSGETSHFKNIVVAFFFILFEFS